MAGVKAIVSDSDFQPALAASGAGLAVVQFTVAGCQPCVRVGPAVALLSSRYPGVAFLRVDVGACRATAVLHGVSATPTFLLFRDGLCVERHEGVNAAALEEKIARHAAPESGGGGGDVPGGGLPKGHVDLAHLVDRAGCQCLNESDERGLASCLDNDGGGKKSDPSSYLESDCDEQLLITVAFRQPVKLFSVRLRASDPGRAPKSVRVFANRPSMDFDDAERGAPTQSLELTEEQLRGGGDGGATATTIPLCPAKFQNVQSVTLFVASNQGGEETTRIDELGFVGAPMQFTNMSDFKRVCGTKGEGH